MYLAISLLIMYLAIPLRVMAQSIHFRSTRTGRRHDREALLACDPEASLPGTDVPAERWHASTTPALNYSMWRRSGRGSTAVDSGTLRTSGATY